MAGVSGRKSAATKRSAKKAPAAGKARPRVPAGRSYPVYELRVELMDIEPPVWRRLRVRSDINLSLFHAAIQVAMGWTKSMGWPLLATV